MKIIELFESISGEGPNTGAPSVFLRLVGCNLNCPYCDTKYAKSERGFEKTVEEVINKLCVKARRDRDLIITGGEPLLQMSELVILLNSKKIFDNYRNIYIETNGTISINFAKNLAYRKRILFVVDYKCPTSKFAIGFRLENLRLMRYSDTLKFVADYENILDCNFIDDVLKYIHKNIHDYLRFKIYFSPIFGTNAQSLVGYIDSNKTVSKLIKAGHDCRLQLQIHKYIWDPNARGV